MLNISNIQLQGTNGQVETYNIKDETSRNEINNINNTLNNLQKPKKYVFMGDSYADGYTPDGQVTSWITLLANKLGLTSGNYISTHASGYGFAFSNSNNYITLLQNLQSDNELTDMYVCGGFNDRNFTSSVIDIGIENFYNLFKTKFPNAKLHLGFIGWGKLGSDIRKLKDTFMYYNISCLKYGIDFLNGCEFALHNYFKYFSSDGIHPNLKGQTSIANALYNCITKGSANVCETEPIYFTVEGGTSVNVNGATILNNGIVSCFITGGDKNYFAFVFNSQSITLEANSWTKIATLSNSLAVGTDRNECVFNGIPCVVRETNNQYSTKILDFCIKNGEIYCSGAVSTSSGYGDLNLKEIQIPAMGFCISGLNC